MKAPPLIFAAALTAASLWGCGAEVSSPEQWVMTQDSQEASLFTDQASVRANVASGVIWFHEKMILHKYQSDLARADWLVTTNCAARQVVHAGWTGWHRDGRVERVAYLVLDPESAVPYLERCRKLMPGAHWGPF